MAARERAGFIILNRKHELPIHIDIPPEPGRSDGLAVVGELKPRVDAGKAFGEIGRRVILGRDDVPTFRVNIAPLPPDERRARPLRPEEAPPRFTRALPSTNSPA